jgi:hypothetical protein
VGIIIKGAEKPKEGATSDGNPADPQGGGGVGHERPGSMPQQGPGMDGATRPTGNSMKMYENDEIWRFIEVAKKK